MAAEPSVPAARPMPRFVHLQANPMTASIGAEIEGVDLNAPLSEDLQEELRTALYHFHVIAFRDQFLDDDGHLALARVFGEPEVHPIKAAFGNPEVLADIVDTEDSVPDRDGWHTDVTYQKRPPAAAVLRCEQTPEAGGDTLWANMQLAYDKLSEPMKAMIDGLTGQHATEGGFIDYIRRHLPKERVDKVMEIVGDGAHHPLVRTHPITGRKSLFVDQSYLASIDDLPKEEGEFLLDFLASRVDDVSIQCRFHWTKGAVVVWDERSTQHAGSADHRGRPRHLRRCTIEGEIPA